MANATEQNQFDQAVRLIEPGDSVVALPGAPGQITATSQNTVPKNYHTHAIDTARTDRATSSD